MSDQDFAYKFRLILLGDSAVGKSSIHSQFKEGIYSRDIKASVGIDICVKLIEVCGHQIQLELCDTVGEERFRSIFRNYYRDAVGGLLVFDITCKKSFAELNVWLEIAQRYAGPYKPVFILVGNKTDLPKKREVRKEEALSFAIRHGMEYFETSAKNGSNIEEVFHKLADKILMLVDDGVIKVEEGWRGVKRGTEHSHTCSSGKSHRNRQGYSAPITLGGHYDHCDHDQGRKQKKKRRKFC